MPDLAWKPGEWEQISKSLAAQTPAPDSGGGELSPWVQAPIDYMKGQFVGAGKAAAGMIPESIAPKAVSDFAKSPADPNSMSEQLGEGIGNFGANVAPFIYAPGFGIESAVSRTLGNLALAQRTAGNIGSKVYGAATKYGPKLGRWLEGTVKGTEGGAVEAQKATDKPEQAITNAERGAVTGGWTAAEFTAGRLAYEALPPTAKKIVGGLGLTATAGGAGMMLFDHLGHHHWVPYHLLYSLAGPMMGVAAGVSKLPPGVVGAASERAGQLSGYEPGGSQAPAEQGSDDELAPQ